MKKTLAVLGVLLGTGSAWALARQVVTAPALGPAPSLVMPTVEESSIANGMRIVISRNTEVPIVEARLLVTGGARLTGTPAGLATFSALMVTEGAGGRDAFQLAEAIDFLGASLSASAGWENLTVQMSVPRRNVDSALALMSDVALRPAFAQKDVERRRDLRQASLVTARDNPSSVAQRVYYRTVFPQGHPYHDNLSGDSASTAALDSASVRHFWESALDPKQATFIVTGDVTMSEAKAWAEKYFGTWTSPATPLTQPAASSVTPAAATPTHIVLVDKPNAAQSVIFVGHPGVDRSSPDYAAINVMNTLLGGSFSSRINHILREERGYTYGAFSGYSFAPVAGPFIVNAAVRTDVTDSSLVIMVRELKHIRDSLAPDAEVSRSRNYSTLGQMDAFETAGQVAAAIQTSRLFGLPLSKIGEEINAMKNVKDADIQNAARKYIDPDKLTIVIVGDLKVIRAAVEKLKLGPVTVETY